MAADVQGVHSIPDIKFVKLKLRYLVKWTGYDVSNNTCEPEQHVVHPALIAAFEIESPSAHRDAIAEIAEKETGKSAQDKYCAGSARPSKCRCIH